MNESYLNFGGNLSDQPILDFRQCKEVYLNDNHLSAQTQIILGESVRLLIIGKNKLFGKEGGFADLHLPANLGKFMIYDNDLTLKDIHALRLPPSLQTLYLSEYGIFQDPDNSLQTTDLHFNPQKVAHALKIHKKCRHLKSVELFTNVGHKPWVRLNNYVLRLCERERHKMCQLEYLRCLYLLKNNRCHPHQASHFLPICTFLIHCQNGTCIVEKILTFYNPSL